MTADIQVLMHMGELRQIIGAISSSRSTHVSGCLFGLWRNSLKQPVIQFVTGPGMDKEICKDIMFENHALLLLGRWVSGVSDSNDTIWDKKENRGCKLVLYINYSEHDELFGQFFMRKDGEETTGVLHREDILPGQSSFRLYKALTEMINAKKPEDCNDISGLVNHLKSRTETLEADTKKDQWYSAEEGANLLQAMFQCLQSQRYKVEMSRAASTHNIQFTLDDRYTIDFPSNFPKDRPRLTAVGNERSSRLLGVQGNSIDTICSSLLEVLSHRR